MFGSITSWDVDKRARRYEVRGHTDSILGAAISADGTTLATGSYDRQVLIWDLGKGTVVRTLKEHTDAVHGVAFSADGKLLASCGADRTVKLWDWRSGKRIATLPDATGELYAVTFSADGATLLAAGADRSIRAWPLTSTQAGPVRSVFAHDGPIIRLALAPDGKSLASSGEDRRVKLWTLPALEPRAVLPPQADWAQSLAFSPDGRRLAVGRFDGALHLVEAATGKTVMALREPANAAPASKSELVRNASLDPPSPRGAARGSKVRLTLTGQGVGRATHLVFREPGLVATILPAEKPDPNRAQVEMQVAPDARVGLHPFSVMTPLGVPPFQSFAVAADAEMAEKEPDEAPLQARAATLPATLVGVIDRPGDVDHFRFEARAGQELVFEVLSRSLGSALEPALSLLDASGRPLDQSTVETRARDPIVTWIVPSDGPLTLRVADANYGGSGGHFYRIAAGPLPLVRAVFPLGVERGKTTRIHVAGSNLDGKTVVDFPVTAATAAGSIVALPVATAAGRPLVNAPVVVVADGPQRGEDEKGDEIPRALALPVPGGASGRIDRDGDVDFYRFHAARGERLIVEVFGRRLGSPIDPAIEVLDLDGRSIPRAILRPIDQTEVAFRDHGSANQGIRLTRWNNLAINDYILFGRELARIFALPRNPDDDCTMWTEQGQRLGMLETTPEQHPMGQPMYKVEILPPGSTVPTGGVAPVTLTYRNDDAGPTYAKDSRVTFEAPADGDYLVRVEDVRGLGGEDFGYHLVIRRPHPDFQFSVATENPNVPRGGTTLVAVSLTRIDGFDGAVEVRAEGLPPGVSATPAVIAAGEFTAALSLTADASAPAFSPPTWSLVATASGDTGGVAAGNPGPKRLDPGGPNGGWITVTPAPNLKVVSPRRVAIRPGEEVSMKLSVERLRGLKGRVPIDVRNLPQGVRVLDIGLNGVLITETQTERTVRVFAERWVRPQVRPFYAVGKAEAAGTEHSSLPIELEIRPGGPTGQRGPR